MTPPRRCHGAEHVQDKNLTGTSKLDNEPAPLMPDPYFRLDAFPRCPTCGLEAHTLTFSTAVDSEDERVLTNFRWRCPQDHFFATALPDTPLPTWRRLTERPVA